MNFGGERLFSLFFLLILVRICTVKPLFCKNFPAARAKFLGSAYFHIFSRSAYYFHFSAFRKFWRALIILRKSSEMTLEGLLRGGLLFVSDKNNNYFLPGRGGVYYLFPKLSTPENNYLFSVIYGGITNHRWRLLTGCPKIIICYSYLHWDYHEFNSKLGGHADRFPKSRYEFTGCVSLNLRAPSAFRRFWHSVATRWLAK